MQATVFVTMKNQTALVDLVLILCIILDKQLLLNDIDNTNLGEVIIT